MSKIYLLGVILTFIACSNQETANSDKEYITISPVKNIVIHESKRGLFSVNEEITWTSGQGGEISKTINNQDWETRIDSNWVELDFRDIHAFSESEAVILSAGDGCEMFKTNDGGNSWQLVYQNHTEGIFFDGMDFWDSENGIAFSDPINGHFFIITTNDAGNTWNKIDSLNSPLALEGEGGFAGSGTGILCVGDSLVFIGTGGSEVSRVLVSHNRGRTWQTIDTEMRNGASSGIYSMAFVDEKNGVAVGGNYLDSATTKGNSVFTTDGGLTWNIPAVPPSGYKSCVASNGDLLIATGRTGIDVSYDKGNTWEHISNDAYYSCVLNKTSGWLIGKYGKMAKIELVNH